MTCTKNFHYETRSPVGYPFLLLLYRVWSRKYQLCEYQYLLVFFEEVATPPKDTQTRNRRFFD
jgi:hypothetical protein